MVLAGSIVIKINDCITLLSLKESLGDVLVTVRPIYQVSSKIRLMYYGVDNISFQVDQESVVEAVSFFDFGQVRVMFCVDMAVCF